MVVGTVPIVGNQTNLATIDRSQCWLNNRALAFFSQVHKPLTGEHRLNHRACALGFWLHEFVRCGFHQQTCGIQIGNDLFARNESIHALIRCGCIGIDGGIEVQNGQHFEIVAFAHRVVVEVVRRGDFERTCTELRVGVVIGDDWNCTVAQRQLDHFTNEVLIAHIIRMHTNRHITQQGLRARGGDGDACPCFRVAVFIGDDLRTIYKRVVDVPHTAIDFDGFNLKVRDRCTQHRIPVDQTCTTVNQSVLVQAHKRFDHRFGHFLIHGEILARPINRRAHAADLLTDDVARLLFPLPNFGGECFASQVGTIHALRRELSLNHNLCGNPCVVGTGNPCRVLTTHTRMAHTRIHHSLIERVSHVQRARDIRWW